MSNRKAGTGAPPQVSDGKSATTPGLTVIPAAASDAATGALANWHASDAHILEMLLTQ